ncbi:FAD binding domain-containing protein [Nannocystis punicea]|uniref:FAD binding domain-containing protein n=1 Tax=Nannocystis punicea TaxID=2995304 RepID=A0ABY7H2B5_9BACT|nr:FAD binding domain-containing protein [Nannocystis poenicansa]WAS93383.1 FAD binding domain-containing protein [Nannocystis poenicansa]
MQPFVLSRPKTLAEAGDLARAQPQDSALRAGGIDLIDRMKEGLEAPARLIELRWLGESEAVMRALGPDGEGLQIGALVTLAQLAGHEGLGEAYAALRQAAGSAATPTIRNAATLGGNLLQRPRCWYFRHADLVCLKKGGSACLAVSGENKYHAILGGGPSFIVHPSTLACALTALDAQVVIRGTEARTLPIAELFVTPKQDAKREHALQPGEVLVRAILPKPGAEQRSGYAAVKEKQSHDWPLAEAAVKMSLQSGVMTDVRVVLGHVAPIPWRSREAEAALEGKPASEALFAEAAKAALAEARPLRDNAYKIPLAQGLLREVLHRVAGVPLPE